MMFVGGTATGVSLLAGRDLRTVKQRIPCRAILKKKWKEHDNNKFAYLNIQDIFRSCSGRRPRSLV